MDPFPFKKKISILTSDIINLTTKKSPTDIKIDHKNSFYKTFTKLNKL